MYNEKTFKSQIFWMRVRRVFLIIVFALAGALSGIMLSDVVINVLLLNPAYRTPIIVVLTLLLVSLAMLLTSGTGKAVQDAYWKMALLRKVIVISKKLDNVSVIATEELDEMVDCLNEFEGIKENDKYIERERAFEEEVFESEKNNNSKRKLKLGRPRVSNEKEV